jgi:hypothetical protein
MKYIYILFSLVGIMITSNNIAMEKPITPALPNDFYKDLAQSYVAAHKDHPHFKDNLQQKKDWLEQKLYTPRKKMLKLDVTKKDGKTHIIHGLNPLPALQEYLKKIIQTAELLNETSLKNLFSSYVKNLNEVWEKSMFVRLKRYYYKENEQLENQGLCQISEHIFKTTFMLWRSLNDIDKIYAVEALHFTKECLNQLKNEKLSNENTD